MKALFLTVLIFATALTLIAQTDELAKLPSGQRALTYFTAFNSGDDDKLTAFFADNIDAVALKRRGVEPRVEFHKQVRSDFKHLDIKKVVSITTEAINVLASSPSGDWASITFEIEGTEGKFAGISVERVEPPSTQTAVKAPATSAELLTSTDKMLSDLTKEDAFSGVVLIASRNKTIFSKAYGDGNREKHAANDTGTKFNLGSINKMFTRIAIGQLVRAGKLSFNDTLLKILPDYPNREVASKITIGQIVTMTSGLGDFFNDKFMAADKSKIRTLQDYIPFFVNEPLEFEPGTKSRYSNAGYLVLGLVIEKLSGKKYYDYVRQNIFKPMGMNDTDSFEMNDLPANTATGYMRNGKGGLEPNPSALPGRGSSAGGGYSTAADMLKFSNALRSKKLEIPADDGTFPAEFKGAGFAGGSEGVNALFIVNGQTGYTIIVLSNLDPPSAEKPGTLIRDWLKQVKD